MAGVGPGGATLLDYSIYDSLRAGFGKVVFIIRREMEADFRAAVGGRWETKTEVGYAFQELTDLPAGFAVPPGRQKPWGTGQAIYSARHGVREPFAVLNADDYYGRHSFQAMGEYLTRLPGPPSTAYAMVGFQLRNTLSEHGHVSRGVCQADPSGKLQKVVERLKVFKKGAGAEYEDEAEGRFSLTGAELVSMNLWGFTPALFGPLETLWVTFLREKGGVEKSEFLIPQAVDDLITRGQATVQVLPTPDSWFGLTYPEDRERVQAAMGQLVSEGHYPENLWA